VQTLSGPRTGPPLCGFAAAVPARDWTTLSPVAGTLKSVAKRPNAHPQARGTPEQLSTCTWLTRADGVLVRMHVARDCPRLSGFR
jgi:hypothetical protein